MKSSSMPIVTWCILLFLLDGLRPTSSNFLFNYNFYNNKRNLSNFDDNSVTTSDSNLNDMGLNTLEIIKKHGYPAEAHVVRTDDGYLLTIHRIPGSPGSPIVYLQHGLLCASSMWVIGGKDQAISFFLADRGYDVWLGNIRGNTYSQGHVTLKTSDPEFWDFSWTEMATYDLPAVITYITNFRNAQKLAYIGHSMGTTVAYLMSILRPDIASKVSVILSLAPVAYTEHIKSPIFRLLGSLSSSYKLILKVLGNIELLPKNKLTEFFAKNICTTKKTHTNICANLLFYIGGFNPAKFNYAQTKVIINNFPAGMSIKTLFHFTQEISSKKFENFNYGTKKNMEVYNSATPPSFNLTKVNVPVALFWSENDWLADTLDVKRVYDELPNVILNHKIIDPKYNHFDFVWAIDAPQLVFETLYSTMEMYK